MVSLDEIVSEIEKNAKIPRNDILSMVAQKYDEMSGLITQEGAALLVAKDSGVMIKNGASKRLQIKNIVPGMRNIIFTGRLLKTTPAREFTKKNGEKGRVSNMFLSDGTGQIRVPLWNEQVDMIENETFKIGDVVEITGGYSRDNIYGDVEVSVTKSGMIKRIDDDGSMPMMGDMEKRYFSNSPMQSKIADLVPGNFEVRGMISKVFRGNFLFDTNEGEKGMVVSCEVDDGTGAIRTVFFREVAESISNVTVKDLESLDPDKRMEKVGKMLVLRDVVVSGKVKKSDFFDGLEMVANSVKPINPLEESKRIASELELRLGEFVG